MKKAVILGVGRMGQAICWSMKKLGYYVIGVDSHEAAAHNFRQYIKEGEGLFYLVDGDKDYQHNAIRGRNFKNVLNQESPDVVISSLPYHQLEERARWCIDNGLRYCDLGGRVDVSQRINEYSLEHATKPVMTDLGLAPGWVNIMAEEGFKQLGEAEDILMMVGGIPAKPSNPPFNYEVTWSVDGLINEYLDDCEVIENGEIKSVKGMDGLVEVKTKQLGTLEAFYTSGGAAHSIKSMKERGVKNCAYKTLRYPGHRDAVRFLIDKAELSSECVRKVFEKGCVSPEKTKDLVVIASIVKAWPLSWKNWVIIEGESDTDGFSAMQKATSFPIASVASLMADGLLDKEARGQQHRDYWTYPPVTLTYKDIPYEDLGHRLTTLGIVDDK
jgi:saccharopine dehydrogenase-like NADP-dependent oxidoreductase